MLVAMWLGLGIAAALAGPGDFGKNFTVSFVDKDDAFGQATPSLWIVSPGVESVQVVLRDDGGAGDAEAGDSVYSGTVNELPAAEVLVVLEGPEGELWRRAGFSIPADMSYPALRLTLRDGLVEGGVQADLSPEEQRALDLQGQAPNRGVGGDLQSLLQDEQQRISLLVLLMVVFVPPLAFWAVARKQGRERSPLEALAYSLGSKKSAHPRISVDEIVLGGGLPDLELGLQVWGAGVSFETLRRQLASETSRNCDLFWLPARRSFGHELPGIHTWGGSKPELAEALHWRKRAQGKMPAGPLFIEGMDALYTGYGCKKSLWLDLQSLARDCPVVILWQEEGQGKDWVLQEPPEEWLRGAGKD